MTVCLASLCDRGSRIVSASDSKISFGGSHSADDIATKAIEIHRSWSIMFAGEDVPAIPSIVEAVRDRIGKSENPTPRAVSLAVNVAVRGRIGEEVEAQVLRNFGIGLPEFLKAGKNWFTESVYSDICDKISAVRLPVSFIVAGFDAEKNGHLFVVSEDHAASDYTPIGFCAIGSGSDPAMSAMAFNAHNGLFGTSADLPEAVYGVCEAKFTAEYASDVGESTFLVVLSADAEPQFISSTRVDEIRKIWRKDGAPRVPPAALKAIPEMLFSIADLAAANEGRGYIKVFGKIGKLTDQRVAREYRSLQRAARFRKSNRVAAPNPPPPKSDS